MPEKSLDEINWASLTHAYGPAEDVPGQIKNLSSSELQTRKEALWQLFGNIFHQGTRYEATPYAVPFLIELVANPQTPDRAEIVSLLTCMALGYADELIPYGLDPSFYRQSMKNAQEKLSSSELKDCEEYGISPLIEIEVYNKVMEGVPLFQSLLKNPDKHLRYECAHLLAFYPEHAPQSVEHLKKMLESADNSPSGNMERAHAILALGLLKRRSGEISIQDTIQPYLDEKHTLLVRTSAAIATFLQNYENDALEILIEAVTQAEELKAECEDLRFNEGNLVGFAGLLLSEVPDEHKSQTLEALSKALKALNPFQSMDITVAMLDLVIEDSDGYMFFKDKDPSDLTETQILALQSIVKDGGWTLDKATFGNYTGLISSYGLPSSRKDLRAYLEKARSK